jgi:hypothetical protein
MHPAAKWAIGFGIGCAVLVAICCGICGLGYFKGIMPFAQKMEQAQKDEQASRTAQREIEALDAELPPALPASVAEATVTEDQLARYARIRTAMAEPLARVDAETSKALPRGDGPPSAFTMMRTVAGLVSSQIGVKAEWRACVEAALPVLRREGMGPTDLARLTEIVEWRYLKRPEARSLGLAPAERTEMQSLTVEARMLEGFSPEHMPPSMKIEGRDAEQMKARIALVNQRLEELRAQADLDVALSGPTLAMLDAHRGELEALPAAGVALLAGLTQDSPVVDALETMGHGASWEGRVSTGSSAPAGAPLLEGQPPAPQPPVTPEGASAP